VVIGIDFASGFGARHSILDQYQNPSLSHFIFSSKKSRSLIPMTAAKINNPIIVVAPESDEGITVVPSRVY
jgi:hypothetical protein